MSRALDHLVTLVLAIGVIVAAVHGWALILGFAWAWAMRPDYGLWP